MKSIRSEEKLRLIILIIILSASLLLLGACSSNSNRSETEPKQEAQSELQTATAPLIKGIVFLDANANGIMESDEKGIPDIVIQNQFDETQTDSSGKYVLKSQQGDDQMSVVQSSLPVGLILTTANESQNFSISGDTEAVPIGYIQHNPDAPSYIFEDIITSNSDYDNYYFELLFITEGQMDQSMKIWVMGQSIKSESQGLTTYYNSENGTMGVYTAATNQVVITPIMDTISIVTPFTFVDELDPETFSETYFSGEENLDGKDVLVFKNEVPGFEANYYVWKEHHMIIKIESKMNGFEGGFYFKDLSLGTVTADDIGYPPGAEVLDLSGQ